MSGSSGSHWEGPTLGSDRAAGGLLADIPLHLTSVRSSHTAFYDSFLENANARIGTGPATAGTHYTPTSIVAGTVTGAALTRKIRLDHNVNAQGPSVRLGGTVMVSPPATGSIDGAVYAAESNVVRVNAAAISSIFVGIGSVANAHPLDAAGAANVAGIADAAGYLYNATLSAPPVLWDNGVLRTLTGAPTVPFSQNVARNFGVRVITSNGIDKVEWYVDGRFVFRIAVPGNVFSTNLAPMWGEVKLSGASAQLDIFNVVVGSWTGVNL